MVSDSECVRGLIYLVSLLIHETLPFLMTEQVFDVCPLK